MSTMSEMSAIIVQLFTCVYRFDMKKRQVSTESGNEQKKVSSEMVLLQFS